MKKAKFFWLVLLVATILLQGCIISSNPAKGEDPVIVKFNETKQFSITVFPPLGKFTWTLDGVVVAGATGNTFSYTPVLDGNQTHTLRVQTFLDNYTWNIETPETSFSDDFNDGNADGWISVAGYPPGTYGNWRVEDGVVVQDQGHDHYGFVFNSSPLSDQTIEARVLWHDYGYAGITLWSQDANNWVQISYPYGSGFGVWENVNGGGLVYPTAIYPVEIIQRTWQTMKVEANSSTGEIAVYLDNNYLFTHTVGINTGRTGLSGFSSGNAGGSFDDFKILWAVY